jgi:cytidine deaminase
MRRLCIYGVAGAGKSTVSAMVERMLISSGWQVEIVKLALPLYRLQQHIYATAGRDVQLWTHDNDILRSLATHLRRINPDFLVEDFLSRVDASAAEIIINDDLRDTAVDYPRLHEAGFRFVHVSCPDSLRLRRLQARGDLNVVPDSIESWGFDRITPDWTIDNPTDDPDELHQQTGIVLDKWLERHSPI